MNRVECQLMAPVLVFLGIAALVGCLIRVGVEVRLRAASRRPDVTDGDLCELKQANRISSLAVAASVAGIAAVGLVYVVVRLL